MVNIQKYHAADLPQLMDKIVKNSIGMDDYFDRFFFQQETQSNYPPYNLVQVSNVESILEIALAGFKKRKLMSTPKMVLCLLKDRKRRKNQKLTTCTKVWLNGVLHVPGPSVTTRKFDQLLLKMGF